MKKWLELLKALGPMILATAGVPPVAIPLIIHGIEVAEASGKPGADKKAIVMDGVKTAASTVEAFGKLPGLVEVTDKGIDTTIAVIKMIDKATPEVVVN